MNYLQYTMMLSVFFTAACASDSDDPERFGRSQASQAPTVKVQNFLYRNTQRKLVIKLPLPTVDVKAQDETPVLATVVHENIFRIEWPSSSEVPVLINTLREKLGAEVLVKVNGRYRPVEGGGQHMSKHKFSNLGFILPASYFDGHVLIFPKEFIDDLILEIKKHQNIKEIDLRIEQHTDGRVSAVLKGGRTIRLL